MTKLCTPKMFLIVFPVGIVHMQYLYNYRSIVYYKRVDRARHEFVIFLSDFKFNKNLQLYVLNLRKQDVSGLFYVVQ